MYWPSEFCHRSLPCLPLSIQESHGPGERGVNPVRFQTDALPGPDAPIQAAMRADEMHEKGDVDGYAVWRRVVQAVEELRF